MKKLALVVVMGFLAVMIAACGSNDSAEKTDDTGDKEDSTLTIKHELGETKVPKNPKKVVVFDYGILDTLDELGIKVAGVPQGNIPTYLDKYKSNDYENVGSLKEPDFEKIAEVDPDLIIISGRQSDVYDQLQEIAPTVYLGIDTARYMDSFKENMETVGEIFGKEDEIDQELADIDDSIAKLEEKAEGIDKKALIVLANDDKISAYGPKSRFGLIHDVFGIPAVDENIEASVHGQNVSFEYVRKQDPDLLYVVDRGAVVTGGEPSAKKIVENKLMKDTKAYKNDDITYLNPEFWYLSGGGLVSVQEMIKEVSDSLE
ncbi:siderophore ABC transporter substrate-binding protein [Lentibacillus sp. L22]|uniref:siderophore ABC transporter substrate-binding protein n=1 Tax=Lentibacillus TaxID=175304 RepID=UPI0022B17EF1|nr:siderophore ABC transporter substrate-binding protein [Lentibacillus daqui]